VRIAVTGSIATDHLMVFPGRFTDQLVPGHLDRISLSFLVDELDVRRGGVAANIAFGLGRLGMRPQLVGAVGTDFAEYRSWLERHGVDTSGVHVSRTRHTARFVCTTDRAQSQIATFYAGAMAEARNIELATVFARSGPPDLVVVAPNDPEAMVRHTEECRRLGHPFAADPSQQLAVLPGEQVRALVDGAYLLFTNEYESALLLRRTGWTRDEVQERVGAWVTTLGAAGVRVDRAGHDPVLVPAVAVEEGTDPTGVGDAFRAGFLWGVRWRLGVTRAAQAGCVLAARALGAVGPQAYGLDRTSFVEQVASTYGEAEAGDIEAKLRIQPETGVSQ
jgi:adenosine kinase